MILVSSIGLHKRRIYTREYELMESLEHAGVQEREGLKAVARSLE